MVTFVPLGTLIKTRNHPYKFRDEVWLNKLLKVSSASLNKINRVIEAHAGCITATVENRWQEVDRSLPYIMRPEHLTVSHLPA
jgi:hypothetical protein